MNKQLKPNNKWIFVLCWSLISIVIMAGIYAFVWYNFYKDIIAAPYYRRGNWTVIGIYAFLAFVFTSFLHGYKIGVNRIIELIYSNIIALILTNVFTYIQIALMIFEFFTPLIIIAMSFVQMVLVSLLVFLGNRLFFTIYPPKKILVITTNGKNSAIAIKMGLMHKKYEISEIVNINDLSEQQLKDKINQNKAVLLPQTNSELQKKLLPLCFELNKNIYFYPSVENIMMSAAEQKTVIDTPLLLCANTGVTGGVLLVKRLIDILAAVVLLILTAPFMLIIALLIKLEDGGPIIFKQERLTKNGAKFDLYKLRSMVVNAEANGGAQLAKQNDDRITKIGKFIRRTRFDEIPQLINILKGELAFVGPRPERFEIATKYEDVFPEFKYRLKVKAGLTGYSQVVGRYNTTPQDKLLLDLYYIKNCSILFDIEILLMTAKVLILPESTQGVQAIDALINENMN